MAQQPGATPDTEGEEPVGAGVPDRGDGERDGVGAGGAQRPAHDGLADDSRVGSSQVMAAVEAVGTPVSAIEGLYDLQGLAGELRAA